MTLNQIVSLREISESQVSPDGGTVAFVIKQADLEENDYTLTLFTVDTSGREEPVRLLEGKSLSQIRWVPDGSSISFVSNKSGAMRLHRISPTGNEREDPIEPPKGMTRYEWSPEGSRLAFLATETVEPDSPASGGIIFTEDFSHRNFIQGTWKSATTGLWAYDLETKKERSWNDVASFPAITQIAWSPDGRKIAIAYKPSNKPHDGENSDIGVLDLVTEDFTPLVQWQGRESTVAWSPDSRSIVFVSQGNIDARREFYRLIHNYIFRCEVENCVPTKLADLPDLYGIGGLQWTKQSIYSALDNRHQSALFKVGSTLNTLEPVLENTDHLASFSFDSEASTASCVLQNPNRPPEIASVDLENRRVKVLTSLHPEMEQIALGKVTDLHWTNKFGSETNGFLIWPLNHRADRRYPLLVAVYGFSNRFIAQAQWMTSYPARLFAARGFAVLLMNFPFWEAWPYGDFKQASFQQGDNHLASIERAVDLLVESGIADPNRKGLMGWSYGSFLTEFAITHSNLFEIASAGEGGLWNPGQWWLLSSGMRYYLKGVFGGPPYGTTYKNYQEFSPALNAHRVSIPLMREYAAGPVGLQSLEFYAALKTYGVPVEQVVYPDEQHVFRQPRNRLASMQRNLDWFSYWLLDQKDPDPAKNEQYRRWRGMKDALNSIAVER